MGGGGGGCGGAIIGGGGDMAVEGGGGGAVDRQTGVSKRGCSGVATLAAKRASEVFFVPPQAQEEGTASG